MHIPDSFLSPATCIASTVVALPILYISAKKTLRDHGASASSLIAACSAFAFVIQMFNVPLPFGGTGHVIGASALACLFGPWVAIFAVSIALAVQALVFGDGGILAYGANVLDMAIVQSVVSYALYSGLQRVWKNQSIRSAAAAFLAVVAGGMVTSVLLGLQALLHVDNRGVPMYFPFPVEQSFPGLMIPQTLVACIEAVVTSVLVVAVSRVASKGGAIGFETRQKSAAKVWIAIAVAIMLVPLGVLVPTWSNAGDAWGEWDSQTATDLAQLPYVPKGMEQLENWYPAPVPDYAFTEPEPLSQQSLEYVLAACLGVSIILGVAWFLNRRFTRSLTGPIKE